MLETLEDRTLLSTAIPLSSQTWMPIGPADISNVGFSGRITGVAGDPTDPNTLFIAAAGGGVWKTSDAGNTWAPLTDNQAVDFMGSIAIAPTNHNVIYAGTGEANFSGDSFYGRGLLVSVDGGATWKLKGTSVLDRRAIGKIAVDPADTNTVFVAVTDFAVNAAFGNAGIWKSSDGGNTWSSSLGGEATDVIVDPTNDQIVYAALGNPIGDASNGIYKSTDGGGTWTKLAGRLPSGPGPGGQFEIGRIALAISKTNSPQTLYAIMSDSGAFDTLLPTPDIGFGSLFKFFKSTDGGLTWSDQTFGMPQVLGGTNIYPRKPGQGWYDIAVTVDPTNANIVYAGGTANGGAAGLAESTDGGNTWAVIAGSTHTDIHAMDFDANGKLLNGNDGGIYRLDNPAPSSLKWTDINSNLQITQFTGIALHPTDPNIAYGGSQDNGTEKFTGLPGWKMVVGGDGGFVRVDGGHPNTVYHTFPFGTNFLERSDDGGVTWAAKVTGIDTMKDFANFYPPYVIDPAASNRLLLGTNKLYETVTRGDPNPDPLYKNMGWRPLLTLTGAVIDAIGIAQSDANTIYVAAEGSILVTFNHGSTWATVASIPGAKDIKVDPANASIAYVVAAIFTGGPRHVFQTTNGGSSWNDITGNLPDIPVDSVLLDPWTKVLYVGTDTGVYASNDYNSGGPVHWVVLKSGFPHAQVVDLELSTVSLQLNTRGYILGAGTHGRGMWELDTSHFSVTANVPSGGITAGVPFNITVNALDPFDQKILGYTGVYTGTVHFATSDTNSQTVLPLDYSFTSQDNDSHTFTVTLTAVGSQTITVSDAASGVDAVTFNVVVNPAATTKFRLTAPAQATAGAPFDVAVTALDAFNNVTSAYSGTIHFSTTDMQTGVSTPADYTFLPGTDKGAHTFSIGVTLDTAGTQTITVTDTSTMSIQGSAQLLVIAAAASHFSMSVPSTVVAGTNFSITVTALDPFSNIAPSYRGRVHFTSTDRGASVILPGDYAFTAGDAGVHTFTNAAFLNTAGNQTITVTDSQTSLITGRASVLVTAAAVNHLTLVAPPAVTADSPFAVTVQARDKFENVNPGYTDTVRFTSTDTSPFQLLPPDYTFASGDAGAHTFNNGLTLITAGLQTITVKDLASAAIKGTVTLSVSNPVPVITGIGPPSVVEQNGSFLLTVTGSGFVPTSVVDWNGLNLNTILMDIGHLQATVPDVNVADENVSAITVVNPAPGGGTSNLQPYTVADAALFAGSLAISGTEEAVFSVQVGTFTDSNPSAPLSDFTTNPGGVTIDWGDNSTSPGLVSQPGGLGTPFVVKASHTYAEDGSYTVKLTVTDVGGSTTTANGAAVIADAALTGTASPISATRDVLFSGTVASFTDSNPAAPLSDFTTAPGGAMIAWGDGTSSAGTVTQPGGPGTLFQVSGSHTYTNPGSVIMAVSINDLGGSVTTTTASARVSKRFDIVGREGGQIWVGSSTGSTFATSLWGSWDTAVTWVDVQSGDFNGDGRADLVGRALQTGQWFVAISNGSSFTTSMWTTWSTRVTWVDVKVGDFNGDGKADIVGRTLETGQWWLASSTGSSFTSQLWATWSTAATWVDVNVGDFNGDGKADITGRYLQGGSWWTAISSGSSFDTTMWAAWSTAATWVDVKVGDFNGDGKDDIMARYQEGGQWWGGISTGSSFRTSLWATWSTVPTWVDVEVGDFNGDGKADIIARYSEAGSWWAGISNGSTFNTALWGSWSTAATWVNVQVGDFNGDGKADICGRYLQGGSWWTAISTGSSLTSSMWATWSTRVMWFDVHADNYTL